LEDGADASAQTPDVDEFSFADFSMPDTPTEAPAGSALAALAAVTDGRDSANDDLDVPAFMSATAFMVGDEVDEHDADADAPVDAPVDHVETFAPIEVADADEPVAYDEPGAFEPIAESLASDSDSDAAVFAQVVDDEPEVAPEPALPAIPFAA